MTSFFRAASLEQRAKLFRHNYVEAARCESKVSRSRISGFKVELTCDGKAVGSIDVQPDHMRRLYVVEDIEVAHGKKRRRIGTKLYEIAAREACRRGLALGSYYRIGHEAIDFWDKQFKKRRAKIVSASGGIDSPRQDMYGEPVEEDAPVFALSCPAPLSLEGVK